MGQFVHPSEKHDSLLNFSALHKKPYILVGLLRVKYSVIRKEFELKNSTICSALLKKCDIVITILFSEVFGY